MEPSVGDDDDDDDDSSISGDLSTTGSVAMEVQDEASTGGMDDFVSKETKQVCAARTCLVIMLLLVTVLVSFTVFYTLQRNEDRSMENAYQGDSKVVIDAFILNLETQLRVLADTSASLSSYATLQNYSFPYLIDSELIDRGSNILKTTDALHFAFHPTVEKDQIPQWEEFATANLEWLEKGLDTADSSVEDMRDDVWGINSAYLPAPVEGNGPFYPMWER
jgi:hypothetical protein